MISFIVEFPFRNYMLCVFIVFCISISLFLTNESKMELLELVCVFTLVMYITL